MQTLLPFTNEQIEAMVVDSVDKVFSTMLSEEIVFKELGVSITDSQGVQPVMPFDPKSQIVVSAVGFIGSLVGVFYLYQEADLAFDLAGKFLGMNKEELLEEGQETINDVLGELANMIGGSFKNKVSDMGFNCRLTIPSIVRGSDFIIESPSNVERFLFTFTTCGCNYVVDVMLKHGEFN